MKKITTTRVESVLYDTNGKKISIVKSKQTVVEKTILGREDSKKIRGIIRECNQLKKFIKDNYPNNKRILRRDKK